MTLDQVRPMTLVRSNHNFYYRTRQDQVMLVTCLAVYSSEDYPSPSDVEVREVFGPVEDYLEILLPNR